jgi:hypothetical protein
MKKWLIIITGLVIILIVIGVLLTRPRTSAPNTQIFTTPTPYPTLALRQALTTPQIMTQAASLPIDISSLSLTLPQTVSLYRVTTRSIPRDTMQAFVRMFGLTKQITNPGITTWLSDDETKQLVVTDSGYLIYTNTYLPPKDSKKIISSPQQTVSMSKQLATQLQLNENDFMQSQTLLAIDNGAHMDETNDFSQANLIGIEYKRILNSLPVYAQGAHTDSLVFWFDKYGTVRKVSFQYALIDGYENVSSPTPDSLKRRLLQGEGQIVATDGQQTSLSSITPQSLNVGYLDDRQSSLMQPVLVVNGSGTDASGKTLPVSIYLPLFTQ